MREIADKVGALLMGDIAHPAGLIARGLLNNPILIVISQPLLLTKHPWTKRVDYDG